jgi:hypothetical protein
MGTVEPGSTEGQAPIMGDDTTREQAWSHARDQAALILDTDLTHTELADAAERLASAFRDIDTGTVQPAGPAS